MKNNEEKFYLQCLENVSMKPKMSEINIKLKGDGTANIMRYV